MTQKKTIYPHLQYFQYNTPFEDNHLLLKYNKEKSLILFDLGDLSRVPIKQLLKIRYVFITHFHMDHIIGFHTLLRVLIHRKEFPLTFYGPEKSIQRICHAIQSYEWNLLNDQCCLIEIYELSKKNKMLYLKPTPFFKITEHYIKEFQEERELSSPTLLKTDSYDVEYCLLDHKINVMGFKATFHPLIKMHKEQAEGLKKGVWIKQLQKQVMENPDSTELFELPNGEKHPVVELKDRFFYITQPYVLGYLTDFIFNDANLSVLDSFLDCVSKLFIESHFLEKDQALAQKSFHLTTKDVGTILNRYGIQNFHLMHFSPRYVHSYQVKDFYKETNLWYSQK